MDGRESIVTVERTMAIEAGFSLADWMVYPDRLRLEREGESLALEPKSMAVLVALAGRAGEVVSADELIEVVWHGRPMGDNPVYKCIAQLRRELGDDSRKPRFIETIPRRGYRLLPRIAPLVTKDRTETPVRSFPPWPRRMVASWLVGALLLTAMLWWQSDAAPIQALQPGEPASLLLLPFETINGDGLAGVSESALREELEAALRLARGLDLVDYRSWREGGLDSLPSHVLSGSLLVRDGRYRLSLDLSNGPGGLLWSEEFEFSLATLPSMLDELTVRLGQLLAFEKPVRPPGGCMTSTSTRACELYLMASDYIRWPGPFDQARAGAIAKLEQAIDLDPRFSAAHAALAAMLLMADGASGNDQVSEIALAALERAEALDPELPELIAARGLRLSVDGRISCAQQCVSPLSRYRAAEAELRQALALKPDLVHARVWLSIALQGQGRFHDAFAQVMLALAHDPMHPVANYQRVRLTGLSGDIDAAERLAEDFRLGHPQGANLMDGVLAGVRMANGDAQGSFELLARNSRQGHDREFHHNLPLVTRAMLETGRAAAVSGMLEKIEDGRCEIGILPWQRPHVEARLVQLTEGPVSTADRKAFGRQLEQQLTHRFGGYSEWPRWGLRARARLHAVDGEHLDATALFELIYDPFRPEVDQLELLAELQALHDFAASLQALDQPVVAERVLAHALDLIDTRRAQGQRGLPVLEQLRERHLVALGRMSRLTAQSSSSRSQP
jgi:DNA-binding winged helix-turn-helix (wHTH) protein/tetratricopeptide (TPR) repeat protein